LAQFLGQYAQRFLQLAAPHPLLEPSMHGLVRRIHAGQFPPLRPGAQNPQHSVQYLTRVSRRPAAPVGTLKKPQQRLQHRPIRIRHLSPRSHSWFRGIASAISFVPSSARKLKPKTTSAIYRTGSSVVGQVNRHNSLHRQ